MKNLGRTLLLVLLVLLSCSPKIRDGVDRTSDGLPVVDLCDLPTYQNKEVYLKCTYSGVEEYWVLSSLESRQCSNDLKVNLDFREDYQNIPAKVKKALAIAHDSYWNTYLKIEAKGVYETGRKGGYGHLGTNKSRFVVIEFVKVEVIRKEK